MSLENRTFPDIFENDEIKNFITKKYAYVFVT